MTINLAFLPLPASAEPSHFLTFGREVKDIHPGNCTLEQLEDIKQALYQHEILLFRDVVLTPKQQFSLTKAFDPDSEIYGHGAKLETETSSILHSALHAIPRVPQVQLIGNGMIHNHEGLSNARLNHSTHKTFHKTVVSLEDEAKGFTRFYRWHIDAALYDLSPPKVTTLYAVRVPKGPNQTCRYDDGTGDELDVPLATTAFVSGQTMFQQLPPELKSVAVRTKVKYAPHPYVWMAPARAKPTGLGIESDDLESPFDQLPPWVEDKIKIHPMLWQNPVTRMLSFQVHPSCATELIISPLPINTARERALYPDGAHIDDLKEVRNLLYRMQRPAIAPNLVYPHKWNEKDLILFHNRGVLHTVVGTLRPDQVRVYHQCNLAASGDPTGPTSEDIIQWA
ncbi:Clavaminate synthase-like protein [Lentinula aff. detonsa]|uniref:Clavaminate synthase-like protein n=1 Tax=Lentinula aff. detonsa TaxID=2804958 RepID=A0AA38NHP6_9AGAR|nr:Clavaminate synthase-like protein [Lentinula aff. detonsa]